MQIPKAVIFDVDGTLYDHDKMKKKMLMRMARFFLEHPFQWRELLLVYYFRKLRETLSSENASGPKFNQLESRQFEIVSDKLKVPTAQIRYAVSKWMFEIPLPYLAECRYPGAKECFNYLRQKDVRIGIFSDYPAERKLAALELAYDVAVSATDKDINQLKPNPKGLLVTASKLGLPVSDCLFVGDRKDKDLSCAKAANMACVLLGRKTSATDDVTWVSSYDELLGFLHV